MFAALLFLILLIIIIVLMLLRVRQKKHPVPQRFRTMANHARKRFTMHKDAVEENELYGGGEQPPAYPGRPDVRHNHILINCGICELKHLDVSSMMYTV